MAFVEELIFDEISWGSKPRFSSSISAKIGFEPTKSTELAVEIKEKDGIITSSFFPIS